MQTDPFGNHISPCSDNAQTAIEDFILGFVSYHPRIAKILRAADNEPDHCLINAYTGMLWMLLESPDAPGKAAPYLARALAAQGTPRERSTAQILAAWAQNDIPQTVALCEEHSSLYPTDIALLKIAQYHHFNLGDAPAMLRLGLKALPACDTSPYVHGMIAFGYEQCHLLDHAEASARRALEIEPSDAWAHHAIAHVMLTQGRTVEGAAFLESMAHHWDGLNSFMHAHNWWHLALFYISMGQPENVLRAYDTHVWGLEKSFAQDQVGAASLLARMELAGIDVGNRWQDVADHIALRGADTTLPFLTMQYIYALGRTDNAMADTLMQAVRDKAASDCFDQSIWQDVALPACTGLLAHTRQDWETCISQLGLAMPRLAETGGSHAQRDLFEQIHLDALMQGGRIAQAQQVLEMRRTYDPDGIPLNRMLAQVYDQSGLPDLAEIARARIPA